MPIDLSKMTAHELDCLIRDAAKRRAELQQEIPQDRPTDGIEAVPGPAWHVMPLNIGTLLQIRHPGLGWLAFVIPAEHRAMMLSFLLQQALLSKNDDPVSATEDTPASGGAGRKLN